MYQWAVFFHILIAMFWMGGMLFTIAVLVPAARTRLARHKALLFHELGTRFSRISWILFPLLVLTGLMALYGKGYRIAHLMAADFWSSGYGSLLAGKLVLFLMVLIISALHDFWLGPRAVAILEQEQEKGSPSVSKVVMASRWAGRATFLLGLAIVFMAVRLVR
jgi:copper resistance protein D